MTDFKGIRGWKVQTLSTDPVASQAAGGSWATGGSLNTGKGSTIGTSTGSSNAFVAGGYTAGSPNRTNTTESYNGTSWTEVADIPTAYNYGNGFGTNTASIHAGSDPVAVTTYAWNGSSWSTPGNNLNTNRFAAGTSGTSTAGAIFGGNEPAGSTKQEQWDGTSWTETTDMSTGKSNCFSGTGIQTASMCIGYPTSWTIEQFNGSSWSEIAEMNTGRGTGAAAGTTTLSLVAGGQSPGYVAKAELWDGSSWTELSDLATARGYIGNAGSGSATGTTDAIVYGGLTTVGITNTEEWSAPSTFQKLNLGQVYFNSTANAFKVTEQPVPGGSWASGTNLNTARNFHGAAATSSDAAIAFGGNVPPVTANTEQYDGSSWTEVNNLNTGRSNTRGLGTNPAAFCIGGFSTAAQDEVESWDGTNWTEIAEINTARSMVGRGGTTTAGIIFGGYSTAKSAVTELWDGTSWTETADLNTSGDYISSFGSQTSAIAGNRYQPGVSPGYTENVVESWNGTSWTEVAEMNTARAEMSGELGITGNLGLIAGGTPNGQGPAVIANTELWNGSSWTEVNDLGTARRNYGAGGLSSSGILTGGGGDTDGTEEWTAPITNKTITVS